MTKDKIANLRPGTPVGWWENNKPFSQAVRGQVTAIDGDTVCIIFRGPQGLQHRTVQLSDLEGKLFWVRTDGISVYADE